ncbi:hypothetical protein ABW21_db0207149 [Orbilia brochopaga]|nr:hypothetical protein ABW21_db0207149 [Drechslerella brochopaga]
MAGAQPSFDSLLDKLRSSSSSAAGTASGSGSGLARPSSNPQFPQPPSATSSSSSHPNHQIHLLQLQHGHGHGPASTTQQRPSTGTMSHAYPFDYSAAAHTRNASGNDSLLQTLESAISSHPSSHRFPLHPPHPHHHPHHPHHPPSFSPQPLYGSIDAQTMQHPMQHPNQHQHPNQQYSPTATTQLNRQLGPPDHGRHSSADDPMVPQNYLMGLLHKQSAGVANSQAHQGRRSVDNIPQAQIPQRFDSFRDGARSTSFAESTSSAGSAPVHHHQPHSSLHDQPLNDLVSSLLSSAPQKQPEQYQQNGHTVPDSRNFMSPAPREVANPAAADLLHQILGRSKPVQDDAARHVPEPPMKQPPPGWAPVSATASVPDTAPAFSEQVASSQPKQQQPIFTYVNPFEQLSKTNPRNRSSPKMQSALANGNHSPALSNNTGLATPSRIPLPFSPPPPSEQTPEEIVVLSKEEVIVFPTHQVEPKTSLAGPPAEAGSNADNHSPPPAQPYVEGVADPFGQEGDPFEGETDPFEGGDTITPNEGSADNEDAPEAPLDVPDFVEVVEEQIVEVIEEDEVDQDAAEAVSVATIIQSNVVVEPPTTVMSPETAPVPAATLDNGLEKAPYIIYKFPMKPFSQITFNASPTVTVPRGRFSDIAKMPRNADQMDRNLISASPSYIVYATGKSKGGVRIIRQEDGQGVVLMKESAERTVNVSVGRENQVLAVGVNGTVLWSELEGLEGPMDEAVIESRSFLFPPSPLQDQNGGLTKSRTHLSLSHPKVFAIGRGRFISFIHADAAQQYAEQQVGGITRISDAAYHANHSRTIDTQKVSKEFSFSEDDTTVVTIDKAGKIKFWDVSKLVEFEPAEDGTGYPSEPASILTEPVLTRSAVNPGEMYKATSVIFVDKQQPYERRQALRYLLIGLQQNHVIQLWDIAIGRAVQELRFPSSSTGSDGLCSLCYHPKSGIIVVGNPNRNTISFIHLSTPKYTLQSFTQAGFIKAISETSPNLPKLDATAIMSSTVEYSLGDRGQLISLEVLDQSSAQLPGDEEKPPIFELYISHTNGLTCISLCKEDLGFDSNMRVLKGLDALTANVCTSSNLQSPTLTATTEQPPQTEETKTTAATPEQPKPQAVSQQQQPVPPQQQKPRAVEVQEEPVPEKVEEKPLPVIHNQGRKSASMSGLGRGKRPRRDVNTVSFAGPAVGAENDEAPPTPQPKKNKGKDREEKKVAMSTVNVSPEMLEREMKKIEDSVTSSFSQALSKEVNNIYRKFDDDKRVLQAASEAKQEAVLRVVSNTLTSGLESTIDKITVTHMTKLGLDLKSALVENIPAIVSDNIARHIEAVLPKMAEKSMEKTLTSKAFLGLIGEAVSPLRKDLHTTLTTTFEQYFQSFEQTAAEMTKAATRQSKEALKEARRVHEEDTQRIAQLTSAVSEMSKTIATLEATTTRLVDMQQQLLSEVELMADEIEQTIRRGEFETAMLTWLQSKELQDYYFENAVVKYNPYELIPKVSQVVVLTVAASVTGNLDSYTDERLTWLEACLTDFHTIREENTQTMLPRITAVLVSRLQQFYMAVAEENPGAGILKRIAHLSKVTSRLMHNATL